MHKNLLWAAPAATALLVAALVYGRPWFRCQKADAPAVATDDSGQPEGCLADPPECGPPGKADAPRRAGEAPAGGTDPDRLIVFRVGGLTCPAVRGIGCGSLLAPVLERLDQVGGVQASAANYTGTMVRIWVAAGTDRDKVAEEVRKVLAENESKPVALAGDELRRALDREEWREAGRIWELSAIEFRTLVPHRIRAFARAEKLDQKTADKLVRSAVDQLERVSKEAGKEGAIRPRDWIGRCRKTLPLVLARAGEILAPGQLERFKKMLSGPCVEEDPPEAPPAAAGGQKSP
jgi:hypothetical protein